MHPLAVSLKNLACAAARTPRAAARKGLMTFPRPSSRSSTGRLNKKRERLGSAADTSSSAEWISSRKTNLPCFPLCGRHLSDKSCIAVGRNSRRVPQPRVQFAFTSSTMTWKRRRNTWRPTFDRGSPSTSSTKGPRGAIFLLLLSFFPNTEHRPRDTRANILTQLTISGDSRKFVKGCRSARRVNHSRVITITPRPLCCTRGYLRVVLRRIPAALRRISLY